MFDDDSDRSFFLTELDHTSRKHGWWWLTYCLMPNHCHLVIETPEPTLATGMQRLASRHAQRLNSRRGTRGHVFQGRYWSSPIESDEYFAQVLRYVALNPVKAGLCADPEGWRWSCHRYLLDECPEAAHARERVDALLESWGGPEGSRYARLFDADCELAAKFGAESPWTHRPPLRELLAGGEGLQDARRHGYRLAEIAAELGVHESTVSRRLKCKKGV